MSTNTYTLAVSKAQADTAEALLNDPPPSLKVILSGSLSHSASNVLRAAMQVGLNGFVAEQGSASTRTVR